MGNENTALKFRVVFFEISEKVRIKERFILNTHLPYTLRFFPPDSRRRSILLRLKIRGLKNPPISRRVFVLQYNNGCHEKRQYTV